MNVTRMIPMQYVRTFIRLGQGSLFLLLLASCAGSYRTITIETSRPSQDLLPEKIRSITLMNRSITDEFQNYHPDSLQEYCFSRNFNLEAVMLDSLAADTTLQVLGDLLFESGRYDVVIPRDRNFGRKLDFYRIPEELGQNEVRAVCELFQTDALLVLERYYNKLITRYTTHPPIPGYEGYVTASVDSRYDAVVKIYVPDSVQVLRQLVVTDTISWSDADLTTRGLFSRLPSVKECLIQTGIQVALELDNRLSPAWIREKRGYFVLNTEEAEKVLIWTTEGDWQSAYTYWLPYTSSRKRSERSKAQYNMALACEMLGLIDQAIDWANKAYSTRYMGQTERYLYILDKRKSVLNQFLRLENQ
ncbi:MAG: DUF6340 family protein [Mangrovibacterium sp.]